MEHADAAPLETPKQAESTKNWADAGAIGAVMFETAVLNPAIDQLNFIASMGTALINHPDILLELLGGVALVVGGGSMIGGGGALAVTGVGAVPGGGVAWAGAGVAATGFLAVSHAAGRWTNEAVGDDATNVVERPSPRRHPINIVTTTACSRTRTGPALPSRSRGEPEPATQPNEGSTAP